MGLRVSPDFFKSLSDAGFRVWGLGIIVFR